jgi:hypothetical protein
LNDFNVIEHSMCNSNIYIFIQRTPGGCRGFDRMVVGFTITRAISAYQYLCWEFEPHSRRGVFDTTLCDKVCQWLPMNTWVHPRGLVGFVLLILLVFCIVLFVLSSSRVLCVQCCQCLWFAPSVFSNIYRNLVLINVL